MIVPANFGARRFSAADRAEDLAAWCGGTAFTDDFGAARIRLPGDGGEAMPGDWVIRRSDGTCRAEEAGSQIGYCADCGQALWQGGGTLVIGDGRRRCQGPDGTRVVLDAWHALPEGGPRVLRDVSLVSWGPVLYPPWPRSEASPEEG